jgi:O-antigen ligase
LKHAISCAEIFGGFLLCGLAAITPWLFGTTEDWSVRLMNIGCLATALIFALVLVLTQFTPEEESVNRSLDHGRWAALSFLILNTLLLAYCATAYANPRAVFSFETLDFTYFEKYKTSLPTTYDRKLTGDTLFTFFSLFTFFWSARYWLSRGWQHALRRKAAPTVFNNRRFRVLLWVLSLNAIVLALQGSIQRLTHSKNLLWMRRSWWNDFYTCFGPFSYRGNAAEYFNLLWPLAFSFSILVFRNRRFTNRIGKIDSPHLLLIPGLILLGVAPFLTLSRGGALIAGCGMAAFLYLLISEYSHSWKMSVGIVTVFAILGIAVWVLASQELLKRFETEKTDLGGRSEIYENAKKIAEDFPLFGTGPGTFRSVYYLYRPNISQQWHAFVHNDWLETRVTLGWTGFSLVILHLIVLGIWIVLSSRASMPRIFFYCIFISLVGTLLKARFDFPFQTYSILFTFVLVSAIAVSSASVNPWTVSSNISD